MTLQQFRDKYLGKQVEFHSFGSGAFNQCVDLVNAYINEVLDNHTKDYTEIIGANAKDFNTKYDPEDFEWIANTPQGVPQEGDIIVWNGRVGGGAGHVAIFLSGGVTNFQSLDQNWSQVEKVTLETHTYANVSGWLRPRNLPKEEYSESVIDELREARDKNWNLYQDQVKVTEQKEARIKDLEGQVRSLETEKTELRQANTTLMEKNLKLVEAIEKDTREDYDFEIKYIELEDRYKDLETEIEDIALVLGVAPTSNAITEAITNIVNEKPVKVKKIDSLAEGITLILNFLQGK